MIELVLLDAINKTAIGKTDACYKHMMISGLKNNPVDYNELNSWWHFYWLFNRKFGTSLPRLDSFCRLLFTCCLSHSRRIHTTITCQLLFFLLLNAILLRQQDCNTNSSGNNNNNNSSGSSNSNSSVDYQQVSGELAVISMGNFFEGDDFAGFELLSPLLFTWLPSWVQFSPEKLMARIFASMAVISTNDSANNNNILMIQRVAVPHIFATAPGNAI